MSNENLPEKAGVFGGSKVSVANKQALKAALADSAADDPRGLADGGVYMNFTGKRGVYEIGPDKEDADPDHLWVVNIAAFQSGWICWKGGRVMARRAASIYGEPVPTPDFNEHGPFNANNGEGWSALKSMQLRCFDKDIQGEFSTSSKSGVSSMASLQKAVVDRLSEDRPYWPIIMLKKESFTAQGNKNFKPVFDIYGWLDDTAMNELAEMGELPDEATLEAMIDQSENREQIASAGSEVEADAAAEEEPATKPTTRRARGRTPNRAAI